MAVKDYLDNAYQDLQDVLSEINISDLSVEEKKIVLSVKNISNIIDAAIDNVSTVKNKEKARGLIAKALQSSTGMVGRLKEMDELSENVQPIYDSLADTVIANLSNALKTFK